MNSTLGLLEKVDLSVHWKDKRMKPLFTFHCPWIRGGGARHLLSSSLGGRHALGEDYWIRSAAPQNLERHPQKFYGSSIHSFGCKWNSHL
ncbi:unnamed protein product, partial [Vitis vinifera]